jgi:hypothetical protein
MKNSATETRTKPKHSNTNGAFGLSQHVTSPGNIVKPDRLRIIETLKALVDSFWQS